MAGLQNIRGLNTVLRNLRNASTKMSVAAEVGLKKGGLFLQARSLEIVPVQLGTLKASSFIRNEGDMGYHADIVVGYTASYAVYVHEDLTVAHGHEFNVKYADEIAKHGVWSSDIKTQRTTFKSTSPGGTAKGGWFPRGENQQAKFLERPARSNRTVILKIVAETMKAVH